jgi:hypothetical protein
MVVANCYATPCYCYGVVTEELVGVAVAGGLPKGTGVSSSVYVAADTQAARTASILRVRRRRDATRSVSISWHAGFLGQSVTALQRTVERVRLHPAFRLAY